MGIQILIRKNGGEQYDITNSLTTVTWGGDINSCARKLEFSCFNGIDIPLSSRVVLYNDSTKLFDGFVHERTKDNTDTISYIAFDWCQKLNVINVSYNFKNKLPHEIMETILKDYGLKVGSIVQGTEKIKKIFIGDSAFSVIQSAYTEQSKKNSKKYMIYAKDDKFYSTEKGNVVLELSFEEGKNILSSNFKESLEGMVNRVIIVDENGNKKDIVSDNDLVKVHGYFQEVYKIEEGKNSVEEAKQMLSGISKSCSLSGFGDTTCITGMGVTVKDSKSSLNGLFYIDSDTHKWEGGNYTIDLELNFKNIMNEIEAGQEEEEQSSSSNLNSSDNSSNTGGQKVLDVAKSKLECKYVWGATGPTTFDCSGLTQFCHKQSIGVNIPRTSSEQRKSGKNISKSNAQIGDIVCFDGHVGLYAGNGQMIHAPNSKKPVQYDSCFTGYWGNRLLAIRRYW